MKRFTTLRRWALGLMLLGLPGCDWALAVRYGNANNEIPDHRAQVR